MRKIGVADLPLHPGKCPKWLFDRMRVLSGEITEAIVLEYGQDEFLRRISDPFWFQAFGCVLGFDWHSSGLTTTVCGALKESLRPDETGVGIAGGKGRTSRKSPAEIENISKNFSLSSNQISDLQYASRMSAKVDSTALQDGYQLYHHVILFTEKGKWAVVQQGMSETSMYARRYHWISEKVGSFVNEPHSAICYQRKENNVLDMTAKKSEDARKVSVDLVNDNPSKLLRYFNRQSSLHDFAGNQTKFLKMKAGHLIDDMKNINIRTLQKAYEIQPKNYEELIGIKGIGPKSVRALALVSDLIYGKEPSWKDPARFSFAHGGKDRIPYEIDRSHYDKTMEILESAINSAKLENKQKLNALKRLHGFF